jgi:hypothetical protein
MAEPVIVDDGGSTRIRQVEDDYFGMDTFLADHRATANGDFKDGASQPRVAVRISSVDDDGSFRTQGKPPHNVPDPVMVANDRVVIVTSLGHTVTATLLATAKLEFVLAAGAGVKPVVEARHNNKRRRYIVLNAGMIEKVELVPNVGLPRNLFTAKPNHETVYTTIAFV